MPEPLRNYIALWKELNIQLADNYTVQLSSVTQSCLTLCDPMNLSTPGLPVHHQLPEFTQTHVHRVGDAIQPSHPLLSPSPPALKLSQHQGLFQWVNSSHEVANILEFLQHHSSKASIFWRSAFFTVQLSHGCEKNHSLDQMDLCWQNNVSAF